MPQFKKRRSRSWKKLQKLGLGQEHRAMKKRFQLFLSSTWPKICFKSKFINATIFENGSSSQSMIKLCHHVQFCQKWRSQTPKNSQNRLFSRKTGVPVLTFYTEFVSTAQSIIYYCGIDVQFSRRWRPQIPKDTQNRPFSQKSGARVFSFKQSLVQDLNQWLILLLCHLVFNFLRNDGHRFQKTPKTGCFPKGLVSQFSLFTRNLGQPLNQ